VKRVIEMMAVWILAYALALGTALVLLFIATYGCVALGMSLEDYCRRHWLHAKQGEQSSHFHHGTVHFWTV
jgi:hypothetical protein